MSASDNSIHVLVIDDNATSRASVKEALASRVADARVVDVASPHDALTRISKQRFDLIILDHELPRTEGSFMDEIARLPDERKPFGVIVGFSRVRELPKIGPAYFLPKPLNGDDVIAVISDVVDTKRMKEGKAGAAVTASPLKASVVPPASASASTSASSTGAAKSAPIDVNFINPFLEGAVVVLETVCETKSERETVFTRKEDSIRGDVSAIIAMNSSTKQGSFAITFEKKAFLAAAGRMLGETYTEVNDENKDVAGEICNQVFGYAKRKLNNEMGYDIQPAIPSIVVGDNHQIKHLIKGVVLAAKFKTAEGWYIVEAAVNG